MSTAPNYRMLFNTYHNGFDNYPAWIDHHKAMHANHPLECAEFGAEWLRRWEAVGIFLEKPAYIESQIDGKRWYRLDAMGPGTVARCIQWIANTMPSDMDVYGVRIARRIVLTDGAIVKEWGVK